MIDIYTSNDKLCFQLNNWIYTNNDKDIEIISKCPF